MRAHHRIHSKSPINRLALGLGLGFALLAGAGIAAKGSDPPVSELKAAYLYNFARFTEWPADDMPPGERLDLCATDAAVAEALEVLTNGKSIGDHAMAVIRFDFTGKGRRTIRRMRLERCELLYVGELDLRTVVDVLGRVNDRPIFTVGEAEEFTRMGGVARFFDERGRLRFEINTTSAQRSGLQLSAQLLQLARIVKD